MKLSMRQHLVVNMSLSGAVLLRMRSLTVKLLIDVDNCGKLKMSIPVVPRSQVIILYLLTLVGEGAIVLRAL
jgi:hypothetical protein